MLEVIVAGIALVFVIEGILPFASPQLWRRVFREALELSDGQLRFFGLTSMMIGLVVLLVVL